MSSNGQGAARRRINWRIAGWGAAASLLLIPLVAMRFTDEVVWTGSDFVFAAAMILFAGGMFEVAVRASRSIAYRAAAALAVLACFLLIWINAAVGIFGDEGNPANLLFLGIVLFAIAGAIVARFRAAAMARAMLATAGVQIIISVAGWLGGLGSPGAEGAREAALAAGLFVPLWLLSAALFRRAVSAG